MFIIQGLKCALFRICCDTSLLLPEHGSAGYFEASLDALAGEQVKIKSIYNRDR
jgi:hypothetical protein